MWASRTWEPGSQGQCLQGSHGEQKQRPRPPAVDSRPALSGGLTPTKAGCSGLRALSEWPSFLHEFPEPSLPGLLHINSI